jgi:hypothetical protein
VTSIELPGPDDGPPHPTKVAFFSAEDLPGTIAPTATLAMLIGHSFLVIDGVPMAFRVSPYVPSGRVYVMDAAVFN